MVALILVILSTEDLVLRLGYKADERKIILLPLLDGKGRELYGCLSFPVIGRSCVTVVKGRSCDLHRYHGLPRFPIELVFLFLPVGN